MSRRTLLPAAVAGLGIAVLVVGYGLGYDPVTTVIPGANSMKPVTAAMFVASGLMIAILQRGRTLFSETALAWLLVYMVVLASAGWAATAHVFGFGTWMPALNEGPPSVGTLLAFGVVEAVALISIIGRVVPRWLCWSLVGFGASSTLGYAFNLPLLYFEGWGFGAMAVHTGLAFAALGWSCLGLEGRD